MLVHWNSIETKNLESLIDNVFFVSSSLSCDAADSKGQPSDDCEEHWTQRSAYQAVKDPHQSSQAGWCRYYDKLSLILFFFLTILITVYYLMYGPSHPRVL